jgi:hypothetical protein
MNHQRTIYSGMALIAAAGVAVSAAACGASSPGNASPSSSVRYYQEGYRYARANIGPSEHHVLGRAGYAKWCAGATAATNELKNAPGGPSSKPAKHWVKGCDAFAASVGLSASATPAPAPSSATTPPATQPSPPTQAPTSPANPPAPSQQNGSSCTTIAGLYAGGLPGHIISDGTAHGFCQPNGVPPENTTPTAPNPNPQVQPVSPAQGANGGQFGGGTQNPCNNPANSFLGDCGGVPKGPGGP